MEDCRVVELRHRGELAESSGELHKGEIPPAKGEDAGGELHRCLRWIILSRGCTGIQERGDDDYNKQGILMDDKRRLHRNTGKNIQTALTHDINNNPHVTWGRTD